MPQQRFKVFALGQRPSCCARVLRERGYDMIDGERSRIRQNAGARFYFMVDHLAPPVVQQAGGNCGSRRFDRDEERAKFADRPRSTRTRLRRMIDSDRSRIRQNAGDGVLLVDHLARPVVRQAEGDCGWSPDGYRDRTACLRGGPPAFYGERGYDA